MANVSGHSVRFRGKYLFTIKPASIILIAVLTLLVVFTALPLVYLVVTAFKPIDELYLFPPTVFTTVATVFLTVFVCSLAAFGLVKQKPRGADLIFALILMALMFPGTVTQIPNYLIIKKLGLLNNYWALIVPKIAVAFNFFLVKQFMEQIPDAYMEAARLDGAGEMYIYWKIIMPMMKPAWATLIVFSFISNWNDYTSALLYITDASLKTLPLAVQMIAGGTGAAALTTAGSVAASTFVMTLPVIIVYLVMQSKVLTTMAYSGIK